MPITATVPSERRRPKAGREQVFAAADEILRGGQRPTIDAIKALLGGGSPNSVVSYLSDWYAELAGRLGRAESPAEGLTPEVHRAALLLQAAVTRLKAEGTSGDTTDALIRSLRAEVVSLQTLLEELRGQRTQYVQRLADAGALLLKKDEEQKDLRAELLEAKSALAVADDRLRRRAPRPVKTDSERKPARRSKARNAKARPKKTSRISRAGARKRTPAAKAKRQALRRSRR
jgi:chromosome segregation ATPase